MAWLPSKTPMPTTLSVDLIMAGIQELVSALHNPSPGSPLASLKASQLQALDTVLNVMADTVPKKTNKDSIEVCSTGTQYEVIPDVQPTQPSNISIQTVTNDYNSDNHPRLNNNNNGGMIVLQESIDKMVPASLLRMGKTVSFANNTIFRERLKKYAQPPRAPKQVKPKRPRKQNMFLK